MALGIEHTGTLLIERGNALLGWPDLAGRDVLDVGCGVRFTQAFINRRLPLGSYTGVDVHRPLIEYLTSHVDDPRFRFHHWPIHHAMYNPEGEPVTSASTLPLPAGRLFDLIWMYSVITHADAAHASALFRILRRSVRRGGALVFSAFIDDGIESFDDRVKDQPLLMAFYNERYLRQLVSEAGWQVELRFNAWTDTVMQDLFVCRPAGFTPSEGTAKVKC